MSSLLPTRPVTDMAKQPDDIFNMLNDGPVTLTSHSKQTAVLVSTDEWNQTTYKLAQIEKALEIKTKALQAHEKNQFVSGAQVGLRMLNNITDPSKRTKMIAHLQKRYGLTIEQINASINSSPSQPLH